MKCLCSLFIFLWSDLLSKKNNDKKILLKSQFISFSLNLLFLEKAFLCLFCLFNYSRLFLVVFIDSSTFLKGCINKYVAISKQQQIK